MKAKVRERTIRRGDDPPLVFTGWLLGASSDVDPDADRWTEFRLWWAESHERYVGGRRRMMRWGDEYEAELSVEAQTFSEHAEVVAWFGHGPLAQGLYAAAGIDAAAIRKAVYAAENEAAADRLDAGGHHQVAATYRAAAALYRATNKGGNDDHRQ